MEDTPHRIFIHYRVIEEEGSRPRLGEVDLCTGKTKKKKTKKESLHEEE